MVAAVVGVKAKASLSILALAAGIGAQTSWQTTHTTTGGWNSGPCELQSAALRVTVHPAWLDVEEDLDIAAVGMVNAGNDPQSLEITGLFNLPSGAAITGALLWDGEKVLQAKLLDKAKADSLYQDLVDRNSVPPPRPRDPILLDLVANGNYRLRIYPVAMSKSRHLRLRYQLPPTIGAEGLEIGLQAAVASLFPGNQIPLTISFAGAGADSILLAMPDDSRSTLVLPRTRIMRASDLTGRSWSPYSWYNTSGIRLIPVARNKQVAVRTSIGSGLMAGHYLNLYAGVTDAVLGKLGRRVEVAVLWKWHAPAAWALENDYGYADYAYAYQAQGQAASLLDLFGQLGSAGNKVGLVHDDGRGEPKRFRAASRGEEEYAAALDYLGHLQGNYVMDFARSLKPSVRPKPGDQTQAILASKERFYQNLKLVKSVYSPVTGVVRHLILVSAGPENVTDERDANAYFDSLFAETPVSVGTLSGSAFAQAGFDAWTAHRDHSARGPQVVTAYGAIPGFEAMSLNVVIRNSAKAYDFPIHCEGGLNLACESLTFHGKSGNPWQDSLEWEAFDVAGRRIGSAKSLPAPVGAAEDTSIALLWAGSESPFSENRKEPPLGPVYGFVDKWASLIGVPKDTLKGAEAFADTGVPKVAPARLSDVLPNYQAGDATKGGTTGIVARLGVLEDPERWILERTRSGLILRIGGLAAGVKARVELFDLAGKRAAAWTVRSEEQMLRLASDPPGHGIYLLKVAMLGRQMAKRIVL